MTPFGESSALRPAAPDAAAVAHLWWVLLALAAIVYFAVVAVLIAGLVRGKSNPSSRTVTWAVGGGGLATLVILLVLLGVSVATGHDLHPPRERAQLTIKVIAHQWWWELQYPGRQANETVITANEMHIPVHTPVLLELSSRDVIHSLWVPSLHGKRDLIPGHDSSTFFRADKPGLYHGQCAEFCGLEHAKMSLLVVAEEPAAFDAWLKAQRQAAPSPRSPQAARGQDLFLRSTCATCHAVLGTPAGGALGPDLTHFATRQTLASGTRLNDRNHLAAWIHDPSAFKPGVRMPGHAFTAQELDDVIAYLGDLK